MSETPAHAPDIAYMAGFSDAWSTVAYLTVRLHIAYGMIIVLSTILAVLAVRKVISHG